MKIDRNEQNAKQKSSIRVNLDSDSNVIDSNFESLEHDSHRMALEREMSTGCNKQFWKRKSSTFVNFDPDSKVITLGVNPRVR
jgi:hypothetical protein